MKDIGPVLVPIMMLATVSAFADLTTVIELRERTTHQPAKLGQSSHSTKVQPDSETRAVHILLSEASSPSSAQQQGAAHAPSTAIVGGSRG